MNNKCDLCDKIFKCNRVGLVGDAFGCPAELIIEMQADEVIAEVNLNVDLFKNNYVNHSHAYGHYVKFANEYGTRTMTENEYKLVKTVLSWSMKK